MTRPVSYKHRRYPPEIITHVVWSCSRFPVSLRLVAEVRLKRGVVLSVETVRDQTLTSGLAYACLLRRKRPSRRDICHLDEVVITVAGQEHWLWRVVDQDGNVLDGIVQTWRDTKAANHLLKRLLRKQGGPPRRLITDKLGSCAAARRQIMSRVEHCSHNRAEISHSPLRRRERATQGF
jgi:putative transposase